MPLLVLSQFSRIASAEFEIASKVDVTMNKSIREV